MLLGVAACALLLAVAHAALPCPQGLQCLESQDSPTAQATANKGKQCLLPDEDVIPQIQLYQDQGLYPQMIGHTIGPLLKLDITLQIRYFLLTTLASWNAITPWHPTAVNSDFAPGFGLPFKRFTVTNQTEARRSRNIALAYAYHRVHEVVLPFAASKSGEIVSAAGFDPNYKGYSDLTKPEDIGNAAGFAVLQFWSDDGFNQDGAGTYSKTKYGKVAGPFGSTLFPANYSDWTSYEPLNDGWTMRDMTKWQPLVEDNGIGYFYQQRHITPQAGWARPWALSRQQVEQDFIAAPPWPKVMDAAALADYKAEADAVLNASANLTDFDKIAAEHFDVKPLSFGAVLYGRYFQKYKWDLTTALAYDLGLPMFYDASIVAWRNKILHQGVRPVSAIRYLYGNTNVTAYKGPGKGAGLIPGRDFSSYLRTMPHTDFPSGTACLCSAFAEFNALFIGSDTFDYQIPYDQGCSTREPGITPKAGFTFALKTKAEFLQVCAYSRLYAGVHFPKSIKAAIDLCAPIGVIGHAKAMRMLLGTTSSPPPPSPKPSPPKPPAPKPPSPKPSSPKPPLPKPPLPKPPLPKPPSPKPPLPKPRSPKPPLPKPPSPKPPLPKPSPPKPPAPKPPLPKPPSPKPPTPKPPVAKPFPPGAPCVKSGCYYATSTQNEAIGFPPKGPASCQNSCDCAGTRTCSPFGWCGGDRGTC